MKKLNCITNSLFSIDSKCSILSQATNDGKRILIASSENAIRGLLMHLCDIPEEKVNIDT